jgi:transcriptional regulator with XRE-family HTH domain
MFSSEDIKRIRRVLNLKQRELAEILGVSVGTIQNYEKGGVIPESKYSILSNLMKHDPIVEKIQGVIKVAGNNNISNTGTTGNVSIDADQELEYLRKKVKELEKENKELKNNLYEVTLLNSKLGFELLDLQKKK